MWKKVIVALSGLIVIIAACAPVQAPVNSGSQPTGETPTGTAQERGETPTETAQESDLLTARGDSQEVVVHWQRSGGFAGICQAMDIYADGHAVVKDCGSDRVLASGELPEQARLDLKGLLETYQPFSWKFNPPKGSADMFLDEYTISGLGSQLLPAQQEENINESLAGIAQSLLQQPNQ